MSRRNGDRAKFQRDRKRKMLRRQRTRALAEALRVNTSSGASPAADTPGLRPGPSVIAR